MDDRRRGIAALPPAWATLPPPPPPPSVCGSPPPSPPPPAPAPAAPKAEVRELRRFGIMSAGEESAGEAERSEGNVICSLLERGARGRGRNKTTLPRYSQTNKQQGGMRYPYFHVDTSPTIFSTLPGWWAETTLQAACAPAPWSWALPEKAGRKTSIV